MSPTASRRALLAPCFELVTWHVAIRACAARAGWRDRGTSIRSAPAASDPGREGRASVAIFSLDDCSVRLTGDDVASACARTRSNSASSPSVVAVHENRSAWRRTDAVVRGCAVRARTASTMACDVRCSSRIPASGASTTSRAPPTSADTTGVPHAMLSSNTFGMPSSFDASTVTSAAP